MLILILVALEVGTSQTEVDIQMKNWIMVGLLTSTALFSSSARADMLDGLGRWQGQGTQYDPSGRAAGDFTVELTRASVGPRTVQTRGTIKLPNNALNTIAALVQIDPDQAEQTVLRLSDLYRGVLGATRRESHSLSEELDICRAYLDVERARFGERLSTRVELGVGLSPAAVQVPVLVLQPLVENAVTHGLSERAQGGSVVIRADSSRDQLTLSVMDDGVGLGRSSREGSGLGIETTRQRLKLCYHEGASLELSSLSTGGTLALLRLPLPRAVN